jgi:hypothetical protein
VLHVEHAPSLLETTNVQIAPHTEKQTVKKNKDHDYYYLKGRADAANGKYNPPSEPFFGLLSSRSDFERTAIKKASYDEGRGDKLRQIRK